MKKPPSFETAEMRELEEVIRGRRTIDQYLHTPIPKQLVLDALDASIWAPNHHVTEPWTFYLLGPGTVRRVVELVEVVTAEKKGAEAGTFKAQQWAQKPGWLIVTCQRSDDATRQLEDYGACSAMLQNFALYLWRAGVGTKWTSGPITRDARLYEVIGADEAKEFIVGLVWYGYPKLTPTQKRSPLADKLVELP